MRYKVYIAKLKRVNANPRVVYKIGITSSSDAMDRLTYDGPDEPHPIKNYFPDIKVMKTRWMSNKDQALKLEKYMMDLIKQKEKYFHNWYEKDPISGITECRIWDYEEFKNCCHIMDHFSEKIA
jgi:hypothetical protein